MVILQANVKHIQYRTHTNIRSHHLQVGLEETGRGCPTSPHTHQSMSHVFDTPIKAILFDLMGTCLDWHSSIVPLLETSPSHPSLPLDSLPQLALDWRAGFFEEIHRRFQRKLPQEDIDVTHRRVLDRLLESRTLGRGVDVWDEPVRERLVQGWHTQGGMLTLASFYFWFP